MFEIGKTYVHASGKRMCIVGKAQSPAWGECLVGEDVETGELMPVGTLEENFTGWDELSN